MLLINPDAIKDVFTPEPFNTVEKASGPQFVCMYIGERSKHLNLGVDENGKELGQYKDDGFLLNKKGCLPADFSSDYDKDPFYDDNGNETELAIKIRTNLAKSPAEFRKFWEEKKKRRTYIPAFRAAYGDQNQSIFKNFTLDQSEFTETEESLQIIDELSKT